MSAQIITCTRWKIQCAIAETQGKCYEIARKEEPVSLKVCRGRIRKGYIEEMASEDPGL